MMQLKVEKVNMDRFPAMWFIPYGKLERQLSLSWLEQQGRIAGQSGGVPGRSWVYSFYS